MAWGKKRPRERETMRMVHRLFWQANFIDPWSVIITLGTRIPALALFNIFIPLAIAFGLEAIVNRQFELVSTYAWYIIWLSVGYAILWGIGGLVISRAGAHATAHLQQKLFENFLHKDYDFYANTFFGSLGAQAARLRDSKIEYNQLMLVSVPKQLVIVVAGIIVIGLQSLVLAGITLVAMALVLSFTLFSSTWRLKYRRRVSEVGSEVAGVLGDSLTQSQTVKSFASEGYEVGRLRKILDRWQRLQFISWALSVPADAGRAILTAIAIAVLLVMTAQLYQDGSISIAIVALVQLYVVRLIAATQEIAEMIKSYEHAMGGAYQAVQTFMVQPTIVDAPKPKKLGGGRKLDIAFEHVTFRYEDAERPAVADFDLTIKAGEKVGLIGYSGSGKTTLTKLLLRFMDVTDGVVRIGGVDVRELAQAELRKRIAYVPQEPMLFHRTVMENVAYGRPEASKVAVRRAAKAAYIDEFIDELPKGYDTMVGERGVKLSGGQRQRVAIARAILKDAPILVLDEATSALDSESEVYIQEALGNLMDGQTALVIAHRLSTIQRMDRIVVMDKGRIVQVGSHGELLKQKRGAYATLWRHQSGGYLQEGE